MTGARSKGSPVKPCDPGFIPRAFAERDWRPLRRSTVMSALRRGTGAIHGYQSDSSSKRPWESVSSGSLVKRGETR